MLGSFCCGGYKVTFRLQKNVTSKNDGKGFIFKNKVSFLLFFFRLQSYIILCELS
jgi:hypothetical protein